MPDPTPDPPPTPIQRVSAMTQTTTGWIVFVSAIGTMCGMMAIDISALKEWSEMRTPLFFGTTLGHVASVVAAFVGGRIIPSVQDRRS